MSQLKLSIITILFIVLSFLIGLACDNINEFYKTGTGDTTAAACTSCKTFETAGTYTGNLGGVTGADAVCMADGNYPGSGTYKALIIDGTNRIASVTDDLGDGQVDWVLKANTNYYRSDGTTLIMTTDANAIFVFGTLTNSFATVGDTYWTGMSPYWTNSSPPIHCTAWTDDTGGINGWYGTDNMSSYVAIGGFGSFCNNVLRLICVEQ